MINFLEPSCENRILNLSNNFARLEQRYDLLSGSNDTSAIIESKLKYLMPMIKNDGTFAIISRLINRHHAG